jgi:4Fe-4S ferredoxin
MPADTVLDKQRQAAADPKRPGERCHAEPGAWTPIIDHARCEAKGDCVAVCPHDVFEIRPIALADYEALGFLGKLKVTAHGRKSAYTPRLDSCQACGLCVVACPEKAITLVAPRP